ncbi:MAG TPA: bifunctional hydroxymethylpyrimidine kinase/phosphomethylpyrimidine kinase [Actinomycetota bacterium]|nr:bifunctional hydroxymethylpyrimidine kinase/phosphomethylpyrimidine kinase [Actinomycetota bacterium]
MGSPARPVRDLPRALTIAGSDSGGGAGIQADLKTFFALGCHGMSAITALTAQNTVAVTGVHEVDPAFVVQQVEAVATDIGVDAAKTGMLASAPLVEAVAKAVEAFEITRLVVDPVAVSKHGDRLLAEDAVGAVKESLLPLAEVVTPNLHEAATLVGAEAIETAAEMKEAARTIHALGPRTVLVKGGHSAGDDWSTDLFYDGEEFSELRGPRFDTKDTHGTGCALSAAIAARLAHGDSTVDAVGAAKRFVSGAIERSLRIGAGYGPVNPGWELPLP